MIGNGNESAAERATHRPGRKRLVTAAVVAGVFAVVALVDASQSYVGLKLQNVEIPMVRTLSFALVEWGLWALLTPGVLFLGRRFTIQRYGRVRWALLHALFAVGIAAGHLLVNLTIAWYLDPPRQAGLTYAAYMTNVSLRWFHVELLIYGAILAIGYAVDYYAKYKDREVRTSQLEAQLAQARLNALKAQLQPHFLFNTLNAIATLVRKNDNASAVKMIAGLSEMLRLALDSAGAQEVTLREELELAERYLAIEQVRFQDRLRVTIAMSPETLDALVPNLVLQPLVENAVRHGIARLPAAGRLEVCAESADGVLRVRVRDDGPGPPADGTPTTGRGVGLRTTRERMRQLYGTRFKLELNRAEGGGSEAVLELPLRYGDGAAPEVAHD
jgi:signal transduction histidine kinase